jgi:hypothetical protein
VKKTTFLCKDKDHTLTYQRLIGFVTLFAYLGFLDTRLYLGPSIFFNTFWFLGTWLPLGQSSVKPDFLFSGLLSTLLGVT